MSYVKKPTAAHTALQASLKEAFNRVFPLAQILATAASNMAVDNLVEKLLKANSKLNVLRIGHPARILPQASLGQPSWQP